MIALAPQVLQKSIVRIADPYQRIREEFRASAIPDMLTKANAHRIEGDEAVEILTEHAIASVQKVNSYATTPAVAIQRKYDFVRDGVWAVWGTNLEGTEGAVPCVKADNPRKELRDGKLKTIKYESPAKAEALPIMPNVPWFFGYLIAKKYGQEKSYVARISGEIAKISSPQREAVERIASGAKPIQGDDRISGFSRRDGASDSGHDPQSQRGRDSAIGRDMDGGKDDLFCISPRHQTALEEAWVSLVRELQELGYSQDVAERFLAERDTGFWRWVRDNGISIALTEGVKKALSLIAHGIPAIALRGVACWHKKGTRELHEAIAHFATPGRTIHIVFDQDAKPSTRGNVDCQIQKLGADLEQLRCKVFIPVWEQALGKGIDDAIAGQDDEQGWLDSVINNAPTLKEYKRGPRTKAILDAIKRLNTLSYSVERATEGEYIPELPELQPGAIHALVAAMNSGKTFRIGRDWVAAAIRCGWNVLVLTPLNSLGQQTAQDLGIPHIHDFGTSAIEQQAMWSMASALHGLVSCPDSLHRIPASFWERPLLLILDEANQVIEHINEGNTLGNRWSDIQERFAAVSTHAIQTGAIALSEDGIPDRAIDFIKAVSGGETVRVFTHNKKAVPWRSTVFSGQASAYRARFIQAAQKGRQLYVTSSQQEAKRLEKALEKALKKVTKAKVIRIDSETNQQGQFRDFFQSPDTWLETNQPDVLILSPSAKSGISIQGNVAVEDAYFDSVWGYFPALATDTHMQLLGRYRPSVPRFIFIPQFILSSGDEALGGKLGWEAIKKRQDKNARGIAGIYQIEEFLNPPTDRSERVVKIEDAGRDYFAVDKAVSGSQKFVAHDALVQRLESAGHIVQCEVLKEAHKPTADLWKEVQEEIWREEAEAIAGTQLDPDVHTLEWARKTLDSLECTYERRIAAHKVLWREEFPDIAFDDSEEVYKTLCCDYGAMRRGVLLQAKAENPNMAMQLEREATESILTSNIRAIHRLPKEHLKARLIAETGVLALTDGTPYSNSDPRAIAIKQKALHYANDISYFLRLEIKEDQSPVEIAHKLLRKLAIERDREDRPAEIKQVGRPGKRQEQRDKVYLVDLSANPTRARLLEAARRKISGSVSPICNKEITTLQIRDTAPKSGTTAHAQRAEGVVLAVGSLVMRVGSLVQWLIDAIDGQTARLKRVDGSDCGTFPLSELQPCQS